MNTYTDTPSPEAVTTDSVSIQSNTAFCDRVYAAIKSAPGKELRANDIVDILGDGSSVLKVRSALLGISRGHERFHHLHHPARGVYVYDETRPQKWVSSPKQAKAVKKVKKSVAAVPPVASAKPVVSGLGSLRPSASVLMEDSAGKFYLVTPLDALTSR